MLGPGLDGKEIYGGLIGAIKDNDERTWTFNLPRLPSRDAELVLVFNGFDPKIILEAEINRSLKVFMRNRQARAGGRDYHVPRFLDLDSRESRVIGYGIAGPFPRYVVLSRRLPRSVLHAGRNVVRFSFIHLPGPRRLPPGLSWATSMDAGSLWHVYLAVLPSEKPNGNTVVQPGH